MCVTDCHDMTLAVKVVLNLNTANQPTNISKAFTRLQIWYVLDRAENIVGIGENAQFQHLRLFAQ